MESRGMNELGSASRSLVAPQAGSVAIDLVSEWSLHPPHPPILPPAARPTACIGVSQPIDVKELAHSGVSS